MTSEFTYIRLYEILEAANSDVSKGGGRVRGPVLPNSTSYSRRRNKSSSQARRFVPYPESSPEIDEVPAIVPPTVGAAGPVRVSVNRPAEAYIYCPPKGGTATLLHVHMLSRTNQL